MPLRRIHILPVRKSLLSRARCHSLAIPGYNPFSFIAKIGLRGSESLSLSLPSSPFSDFSLNGPHLPGFLAGGLQDSQDDAAGTIFIGHNKKERDGGSRNHKVPPPRGTWIGFARTFRESSAFAVSCIESAMLSEYLLRLVTEIRSALSGRAI